LSKRVIRLPEACNKTGFSKPTIYRKMRDGTFPRPIKLGDRAVGFVESELDAWIEQRIAVRDGGSDA
jgi:prophage regulatory protein